MNIVFMKSSWEISDNLQMKPNQLMGIFSDTTKQCRKPGGQPPRSTILNVEASFKILPTPISCMDVPNLKVLDTELEPRRLPQRIEPVFVNGGSCSRKGKPHTRKTRTSTKKER